MITGKHLNSDKKNTNVGNGLKLKDGFLHGKIFKESNECKQRKESFSYRDVFFHLNYWNPECFYFLNKTFLII